MATTQPLGEAGWTCQACKCFVPNGVTHYCQATAVSPWTPGKPSPPSATERIAAALERIATELERRDQG